MRVIAALLVCSVAGFGADFFETFRAAVVKGDKQAVASMTSYPFLFEGKSLKQPEFIQIFDRLFDSKARQCFRKAKAVPSKEGFEVFCGQTIFLFEKKGDVYRFASIGVND